MGHWLAHVLGLDNEAGYWYAWWSGFGADLGELAVIGGLASMYRRHNCHVRGCWRLGRHPAGPHLVCARHHPSGPPAAGDLR